MLFFHCNWIPKYFKYELDNRKEMDFFFFLKLELIQNFLKKKMYLLKNFLQMRSNCELPILAWRDVQL